MSEKIKIMRIFDYYDGPSNYYLFDRMRLVDKSRYESQIVYLAKRSDEKNNLEADFPCHYLSPQKKLKHFHWPTVFKLKKLLLEQKIDILHCNRHSATVYGVIAGWLAKTPVVMSHVHGMNRCRNWRRRMLYRILSKRLDLALGCAEGVRDDIIANYPGMKDKAVALVNSIDYHKFHDEPEDRAGVREEFGIPDDAFVYIFPARLAPKKDHGMLFDALKIVHRKHPNVWLILPGEGPLKADVARWAVEKGVNDKVILPGQRKDVPRLLKACDGFVLSSTREGMPLTVFEGIAAGLPVVATGGGGTCEMLDGGKIGWYVTPRTTENFAKAMIEAIELPADRRKALIESADEKMRTCYSHAVAVKQLEGYYEETLKKVGRIS